MKNFIRKFGEWINNHTTPRFVDNIYYILCGLTYRAGKYKEKVMKKIILLALSALMVVGVRIQNRC